jgi:membrane protein required for colicin V production
MVSGRTGSNAPHGTDIANAFAVLRRCLLDGAPLQPYDFVMLAVLVLATIFGAWKGMAWQLASVASIVVSALVAMQFSGTLAPVFGSNEPWNRIIAMLLLYLATSLAIWLAFRLVAGVMDKMKLKEFDHQIGAGFGLLKGAILCLVITFFVVTLSENGRQAVLTTYSGRYITLLIQKGVPMMPDDVRQVLGSYIDELDRKLDPNAPAGDSVERRLQDTKVKDVQNWKQELESRFSTPNASSSPSSTKSNATPKSGGSSWLPDLRMDDIQGPSTGGSQPRNSSSNRSSGR